MTSWMKQNAWHILATAAFLLMLIGQWQERANGLALRVDINSTRIERMEVFTSQERARLDDIYLRRDLSNEQLRSIAVTLDNIERRIARIEAQTR